MAIVSLEVQHTKESQLHTIEHLLSDCSYSHTHSLAGELKLEIAVSAHLQQSQAIMKPSCCIVTSS